MLTRIPENYLNYLHVATMCVHVYCTNVDALGQYCSLLHWFCYDFLFYCLLLCCCSVLIVLFCSYNVIALLVLFFIRSYIIIVSCVFYVAILNNKLFVCVYVFPPARKNGNSLLSVDWRLNYVYMNQINQIKSQKSRHWLSV